MTGNQLGVLMCILGAALACGGGRPPAAPGARPTPRPSAPDPRSPRVETRSTILDEMLLRELAEDHAFAWSSGRRLRWADFQGAPATRGSEGAVTAYALSYAWKCLGQRFDFRVLAAFRPRLSWVKQAVLRDSVESRRTLRHEQTHFDLTEVHARRMRRYFGELAGACRKADSELNELAQRMVQEEKAEQRRYDAETAHGLIGKRQAEWTAEVARQLDALGRYAAQ